MDKKLLLNISYILPSNGRPICKVVFIPTAWYQLQY